MHAPFFNVGILDKSSMSAAANSKLLIEHTNIQKQISTLVFAGVPLLSRFWRAYSTADSEPSVSQRCLNMAFERMYDARNSGKARVTVWTVILNVMNSVNSGPRDDEMGKVRFCYQASEGVLASKAKYPLSLRLSSSVVMNIH